MSIEVADVGERVEFAGAERYPLRLDVPLADVDLADAAIDVDDEPRRPDWFDAVFVDELANDQAGTIVRQGAPAEIKGCCAKQGNGRSGRWWIRRRNHDKLLEADGHYILVVYSPSAGDDDVQDRDDVDIKRIVCLPAHVVDAFVADSWTSAGDGRDVHAKLSWRALLGSLKHPGDADISDLGREGSA